MDIGFIPKLYHNLVAIIELCISEELTALASEAQPLFRRIWLH